MTALMAEDWGRGSDRWAPMSWRISFGKKYGNRPAAPRLSYWFDTLATNPDNTGGIDEIDVEYEEGRYYTVPLTKLKLGGLKPMW
jgi:hypothetical protein